MTKKNTTITGIFSSAAKTGINQAAKAGANAYVNSTAGTAARVFLNGTGRNVVDAVYGSGSIGKAIVKAVGTDGCKNSVIGAAAKTSATKALRGNAVGGAAVFAISTGADFVRYANGDLTGKQLAKNTVVNASSAAGGVGGWAGGAAIGTAICPVVGTLIGGLLGSFFGSKAAGDATRAILD